MRFFNLVGIMKSILKFTLIVLVSFCSIVMLSVPYAMYKQSHPLIDGVTNEQILLNNVRLINYDSKSEPQVVNIRIDKGEIINIATQQLKPKVGEFVIDGQQKYVTPGLFDMHVHIHDRHDLLSTLAHGLTHVRSLNGSRKTLRIRDEVKSGHTIGPDMFVGSPAINQKSQFASSSAHYFVDGEKEAASAVHRFHAMGYDVIKIYDGLRADVFDSIVEVSQELDIPFAGHPSFFISTEDYLGSGAQSLEHMEMLYQTAMDYSNESGKLNSLIDDLKKFDMPVTANIIDFHHLAQIVNEPAHLNQINTETINSKWLRIVLPGITQLTEIPNGDEWLSKSEFMGHMTKKLYDAGIPMLVGSDAGANLTLHGYSSVEEMLLLKSHGISELQILKSATTVAAQVLHLGQQNGSITRGYQASLVLLESDPRENLSAYFDVQGVIHNQRYFDNNNILLMKKLSLNEMNYFEYLGWQLTSLLFG